MVKIKSLFVFYFVFCVLFQLSAGVEISRVMLKNGSSLRGGVNSSSLLECQIDNPDTVSHELELVLRTENQNYPEENINSWKVFSPAASSIFFRGNARINQQEKFELVIYCDKVRLKRKNEYMASIKLASLNEKSIGIWNDSGDIPGGFSKRKHFKDKFFSISFGAKTFPLSGAELANCTMLIIVRPDFRQYTAKDFSLVLEYAANGGKVIFTDPAGILDAAKTPLEKMLPLVPLKVRKTHSADFLSAVFPDLGKKGILPDCKTVDILESSCGDKEGITFASYDDTPIFRQGKFGLGTVKVLAFSPEDEVYPSSWNVSERAINMLCRIPVAAVNKAANHTPLDMLTGFTVLPLSVVRNIVGIYFFLLILILAAGYWKKRIVIAWVCCAFVALLAAAAILIAASKMTDRKAKEIISSIEIVNVFAPDTMQKENSFFSIRENFCRIEGSPYETFYQLSLPRNTFGYYTGGGRTDSFSKLEPLKITRNTHGKSGLEMTLFPKSPKRYVIERSGKDLFCLQENLSLPRLSFREEAVIFENWKLPDHEKAEGVFFIFPGGSSAGSISGDGTIIWEKDETLLLSDPMMTALRKSAFLLKSYGAPFLAAVFPAENNSSHPGKKLLLYPLQIAMTSGKIFIPSFLIRLSAANNSSRMLFDGNLLRDDYSIMAETSPELRLCFPSALRKFTPEEVRIKVSHTARQYVTIVPKLQVPGKKIFLQGKKTEEEGVYIFKGEDLKKIWEEETASIYLILDSPFTEAGQTASISGTKQIMWILRSLSVSVKGRLDNGNKKILF